MEIAVPTNGCGQPGAQRAFANHKTPSSRGRRKRSQSGSSDGGPSEEQTALTSPTETQSSRYQTAAYEVLLEANNSFLRDDDFWLDAASADSSRALFRTLLTVATDASKAEPFSHPAPQTTLFADNHFCALCRRVSGSNEARVVRDILPLIVPSAENLAITGAAHLEKLVDGVNQSWDSAQPLVSPRPQPDYSVGFARTAFTPNQLDRLGPYLGDRGATTQWESLFMGTRAMHFPFLTCEVKCGDQALAIADRQNAHSMTLAVRGIVELFRLVGCEAELNRRVLAFSISHDDNNVRIYGHYPVFENSMSGRNDCQQEQQSYLPVKYYRHKIHAYDFTVMDGRDKWTAYRIVRYIYDEWMSKHLDSLCTVIDQLPVPTLS